MISKSNMDDIEQLYDSIAYKFHRLDQDRVSFYIDKFLFYLSGKTILDIGCGTGLDVKCFLDRGYDAYGLDISANMLDVALQNGVPSSRLIKSDALYIDSFFSKDTLDGIWAMSFFVHMDKDISVQMFYKIYCLLKDNGVFYLSIKKRTNGSDDIVFQQSKSSGVIKKYILYDNDEICRFLINVGFNIIYGDEVNISGSDYISIIAQK